MTRQSNNSSPSSSSAEKNSSILLKPPELSLAKGGGSLKGAEEKFQANPVTASAGITIGLPLSPGRGGAAPSLSLSYDSGCGNGEFGLGWSLGLPSIVRQTSKRLPLYDDLSESDVFVLSGAEDLVPVEDLSEREGCRIRRYRPRVEGGFSRIERWTSDSGICHWRVYGTDGSVAFYGLDGESRIADPQFPQKIFRWLPSKTVDVLGNVVHFHYLEDGVRRLPQSVLYGNIDPNTDSSNAEDFHFCLSFEYEDRPDHYTDRHAGFAVRTSLRCKRINMEHRFPELGSSPLLVRSLLISYTQGESGISLLSGATHRGHRILDNGEEEVLEMPALVFEYSGHAWNSSWKDLPDDAIEDAAGPVANSQWLDLWGEGIPGMLTEHGEGWWYKRNLGEERFAPSCLVSPKPHPGKASGLLDIEGDGHLWQVQHSEVAGSARLNEDGTWGNHRPFRCTPKINFEDPKVRFLDLDGDGRAEVVLDEGDHLIWYPSEGEEGYGAPEQRTKEMLDEAPQLLAHGKHEAVFLADMSGDGLADITRIRNSEVCYWPNLGHGRFGEKIVMRQSPFITHPENFDPAMVRLADLDGTGPADLLYMENGKVQVWLNWSGERFGSKREFALPENSHSRLEAVDLLGQGTACLVWMSPLPEFEQKPVRYLDLMAGKKPHIMTKYSNRMGKEVQFEYTPSTVFYLQDRAGGNPWVTRLPHVVQCLTRVITTDLVTGWTHSSSYTYHHGCYDGTEREFRGFGRVDTIDTEHGLDSLTDQEPVLTKTWFHLGVAPDGKWLPERFSTEYWKSAGIDHVLQERIEPQLPAGLSPRQWREAHRAFKGHLLHEEIYGLDSNEAALIPYSTSDHFYAVSKINDSLIPGDRFHPASVWLITESESISYHFERNESDPRIAHNLTLMKDKYGRPEISAAVVYGRNPEIDHIDTPSEVWNEQIKRHIVVTETVYADDYEPSATTANRAWRMGPARKTRTSELTGIKPSKTFFTIPELLEAVKTAEPIDFEQIPDTLVNPPPSSIRKQMRLVELTDAEFWNDALTGPRASADNTPGLLGMVYQSYALSYTEALLEYLFGPDRITDAMLIEGGYKKRDDGNWWASSGVNVFGPDAASRFYHPVGMIDPFNSQIDIAYDSYDLLVTGITDSLGNTTTAVNDYRTLAPSRITDPNGNRTAIEQDALGIVISSTLMGKEGANEGDTPDDPTVRMTYSLTDFADHGTPNWVRSFAREKHGSDNPRWQEKVEYSGGLGQVVMTKVQAEPGIAKKWDPASGHAVEVDTGTALRWVGTGRTVLNNKGKPVKQYEPYFSVTDAYESEPELVETGVTPVMHYDPLGRLIQTDNPDGTFSRVEFTPWLQKSYDPNDTVMKSNWYSDRGSPDPLKPSPHDPQSRAAWLAAQHRDTPGVSHLDSLGRAFYVVADNGADGKYESRTVLDIEGNQSKIIDAGGNTVMEYLYGIHGEKAYSRSMDAGERRTFLAVDGKPVSTWDSRKHRMTAGYDELRRPLKQYLSTDGASEILVGFTVYGESMPDPKKSNHRGRIWKAYDQSGMVESVAFDFKGNLLESSRQFAKEYQAEINWESVTGPSDLLNDETFRTSTEYDALNRAVQVLTPYTEKTDTNEAVPASVVLPTYNEGNLLERVDVKLRGSSTVTSFVTDINYDAKGQRENIRFGNGTSTSYTHDPQTYRLTNLTTTRPSDTQQGRFDVLQNLTYTYDPVGNITQITDDAQQTVFYAGQVVSPTQTFEYDALYRLVKSTGREHCSMNSNSEPEPEIDSSRPLILPEDGQAMRNYSRSWKYDKVGNILSMLHSANSNTWNRGYDYASDSNRLNSTTVGSTVSSYVYNEHGSMKSMPHLQTIDWNYAEQMSHVVRGTTEAWYTYDGNGQRVRKVVVKGGIIEERLYMGNFEMFRKRIGGKLDLERETLHVMDDKHRIALVDTKTVENGSSVKNIESLIRYQLSNHLDSASLELDDKAKLISYEEYYPYGDTSYRAGRSDKEVSEKRYKYTGKEKDEETGLYYHGARYYACWIGRWTAADPIGVGDGGNLYAYVRGNPLTLSDPTGNAGEKNSSVGQMDDMQLHRFMKSLSPEDRSTFLGGTTGAFHDRVAATLDRGKLETIRTGVVIANEDIQPKALLSPEVLKKLNDVASTVSQVTDFYATFNTIFATPMIESITSNAAKLPDAMSRVRMANYKLVEAISNLNMANNSAMLKHAQKWIYGGKTLSELDWDVRVAGDTLQRVSKEAYAADTALTNAEKAAARLRFVKPIAAFSTGMTGLGVAANIGLLATDDGTMSSHDCVVAAANISAGVVELGGKGAAALLGGEATAAGAFATSIGTTGAVTGAFLAGYGVGTTAAPIIDKNTTYFKTARRVGQGAEKIARSLGFNEGVSQVVGGIGAAYTSANPLIFYTVKLYDAGRMIFNH